MAFGSQQEKSDISKNKINEKIENTMNIKRIDEDNTVLKTYSFKLSEKKHDVLKEHLKNKGVGFSTGIRMIVFDYMKEVGLL